ncbi:MAG: S8 family serine peptidase [Gaiellaceae bacterium]
MPTRRLSEAALVIVALAATTLAVGFGVSDRKVRSLVSEASSWRGLVGGGHPAVTVGQRVLVVLRAPSMAQRVALNGGVATQRKERTWTRSALAAQRQLLSELSTRGIRPQVQFSYSRVLNGFSAPLDARAIAVLERRPEVAGVYPVRVAYPASVSSELLAVKGVARGASSLPSLRLPGYDGRGVTIALLDTGVDRAQPYLRGRILPGIDVVGGDPEVKAAADPGGTGRRERHGTEMAGILVGAGGPSGVTGIAPGASVLPIRVAGWQQDLTGGWAVYARTDQLIAGLERAVDPNLDGDAHDAARVALVGAAVSYGAFADSPEARAIQGALQLDTMVVSPVGNDGPAGPGYGSVSSPGGAPAALTAGAADLRAHAEEVPVAVRAGLNLVLDRRLPLAGAVGLTRPRELELAAPRRGTGPTIGRFFDGHGRSLVAGRAALIHGGGDPQLAIDEAAQAGATAVVVYGTQLPAGGLGVDEAVDVPVVSVPLQVAQAALDGIARNERPTISIGIPSVVRNGNDGEIAPFSSRGLAFDGRVKPDVAAPGVALVTSEPGANEDGTPRFGTVNGSSPAAAVAAGAAAVLAQARPGLRGLDLKSLLTGTARSIHATSVTAQGAGLVDLGAAAAGEISAEPDTLAFGRAQGDGWHSSQEVTIRNVSTRRLLVRVRSEGSGGLVITSKPRWVRLKPGGHATVTLRARLNGAPPPGGSAEGSVLLVARGAGPLKVPWAITYGEPPKSLISSVALSADSFKPSDTTPAVLSLQAGLVLAGPAGAEVHPLSRLDVELWRGKRRIGLLARLRDLLPGRVAIGLTGRASTGSVLEPGRYRVRLLAFPTTDGPPTSRTVAFRIK